MEPNQLIHDYQIYLNDTFFDKGSIDEKGYIYGPFVKNLSSDFSKDSVLTEIWNKMYRRGLL